MYGMFLETCVSNSKSVALSVLDFVCGLPRIMKSMGYWTLCQHVD